MGATSKQDSSTRVSHPYRTPHTRVSHPFRERPGRTPPQKRPHAPCLPIASTPPPPLPQLTASQRACACACASSAAFTLPPPPHLQWHLNLPPPRIPTPPHLRGHRCVCLCLCLLRRLCLPRGGADVAVIVKVDCRPGCPCLLVIPTKAQLLGLQARAGAGAGAGQAGEGTVYIIIRTSQGYRHILRMRIKRASSRAARRGLAEPLNNSHQTSCLSCSCGRERQEV